MGEDVAQLNAELARTYSRLAELSRDLAAEQVLTRSLRTVIALLPYNQLSRGATLEPDVMTGQLRCG